MISDAVIDALVASGCSPEQIAAAVKASKSNAKSGAERQAAYRARLKEVTNVTSRDGSDVTVTDNVTDGSLSPVPLLSPTPPNNPLTPKPSKKTNSRGTRLPEDWTMSGPDLAYALSKNLSEREAVELFERFCSWAWSASGSNAVKVNWHQAWQGWVQRDGPKIVGARGSPVGKPLTEHQQKQRESREIINGLQNFGSRGRDSREQDPGLLRYDPGDRPAGVRGGTGGDVVDISAGSRRESG